jgi:hypothetical protein
MVGSTILLDEAVAAERRSPTRRSLSPSPPLPRREPHAIGLPAPLTQGARADLVLTDDAGAVSRVMRHGD